MNTVPFFLETLDAIGSILVALVAGILILVLRKHIPSISSTEVFIVGFSRSATRQQIDIMREVKQIEGGHNTIELESSYFESRRQVHQTVCNSDLQNHNVSFQGYDDHGSVLRETEDYLGLRIVPQMDAVTHIPSDSHIGTYINEHTSRRSGINFIDREVSVTPDSCEIRILNTLDVPHHSFIGIAKSQLFGSETKLDSYNICAPPKVHDDLVYSFNLNDLQSSIDQQAILDSYLVKPDDFPAQITSSPMLPSASDNEGRFYVHIEKNKVDIGVSYDTRSTRKVEIESDDDKTRITLWHNRSLK